MKQIDWLKIDDLLVEVHGELPQTEHFSPEELEKDETRRALLLRGKLSAFRIAAHRARERLRYLR